MYYHTLHLFVHMIHWVHYKKSGAIQYSFITPQNNSYFEHFHSSYCSLDVSSLKELASKTKAIRTLVLKKQKSDGIISESYIQNVTHHKAIAMLHMVHLANGQAPTKHTRGCGTTSLAKVYHVTILQVHCVFTPSNSYWKTQNENRLWGHSGVSLVHWSTIVFLVCVIYTHDEYNSVTSVLATRHHVPSLCLQCISP